MRDDLTEVRSWTQIPSDESGPDKRAEQFKTVERVLDKWDQMPAKSKRISLIIQSTGSNSVRQGWP